MYGYDFIFINCLSSRSDVWMFLKWLKHDMGSQMRVSPKNSNILYRISVGGLETNLFSLCREDFFVDHTTIHEGFFTPIACLAG